MEQTKALNALEPFIALSKTATSPRAAADLIERATSAPNTYVFAELLRAPALRALAASHPDALRPHLALLRAFSHGDYAAYHAATPAPPPLGDAQRLKLRQLTLLSLAASGRRDDLTYARLQARLGLATPAELETLVATAIDARLVDARLDPARQRLRVTRVAPLRDVGPRDPARMRAALAAWSARCADVLADLEGRAERVRARAAARARCDEEAADKLAVAVAEMRESVGDRKGAAAAGVAAREQLARRAPAAGSARRTAALTDMVAGSARSAMAEEAMDLDVPTPAVDDGKKRAGKRKM